jgi:hypothetical protein
LAQTVGGAHKDLWSVDFAATVTGPLNHHYLSESKVARPIARHAAPDEDADSGEAGEALLDNAANADEGADEDAAFRSGGAFHDADEVRVVRSVRPRSVRRRRSSAASGSATPTAAASNVQGKRVPMPAMSTMYRGAALTDSGPDSPATQARAALAATKRRGLTTVSDAEPPKVTLLHLSDADAGTERGTW